MSEENKSPVIRYTVLIVTVIVSAIILFALIPTLGIATEETRTGDNEGASDLRFNLAYNKSYTRTYKIVDDSLTITGGPEDISQPVFNGIVYADSNITIMEGGARFYLIGEGYASPAPSLGQWFTIKNNNNGVTIAPGYGATVGTLNLSKPTWAYIPAIDGGYAYFDNGAEVVLTDSTQRAIAGLYAGWGGYDDNTFNLTTNWGEDNGGIYGYWSIPNEGATDYTAPGAVPNLAPIITSGVWKYAVNEDGETIRITDYIGEGGNVTIPAEIDGYPVLTVGRGTGAGQLFNVNITGLTISEGIKNIASFCFYQNEGVTYTGSLSLPSSLEYIGAQAFRYAEFGGNLVIPENVGYIGYNAFEGGLYSSLVVKSSAEPLTNAYANTSINEVLNLGGASYSKTSYGLNAGSVATVINGDGFIANASYTYTVQRTDITAVLFWLLPVIFLIGLAVYFINHINNRDKMIGGWKK